MPDDIYTKLREKIDQYAIGFASTESGVEIKILKKLFTEEEAEMYMNLTADLQTAAEIAEKINRDPGEVEALLQRMTEKGHTYPRYPKKKGEPFYFAAAAYIHGIIEHQVNRMDAELAQLTLEHFEAGPVSRPGGVRAIPVLASIDETTQTATYDNAETIIRKKDRIALADCFCNDLYKTGGKTCDQLTEVCFFFDFYADYYVDRGMGRRVTQEEALERLQECNQAGLIPRFSDSDSPEALCNCCPTCCKGIVGLKSLPKPALEAGSNHFALVNDELCSACEMCIDRCPMDAIGLSQDDVAEISLDRCIGCGLCVSVCPDEALSLKLKPEDQRFVPPKKGVFMRSTEDFEAIFSEEDSDA